MSISTRSYTRPYLPGSGLPSGVKGLLIANAAVFLLQFFSRGSASLGSVFALLELRPVLVTHGYVWQLATYMFLHGGIFHILFNMLALWMFGCELENFWGTQRFLRFYFLCGIGAGVCVVAANYLFGDPNVATIGSSGAIYGVLAASAALWPDRMMMFYFLFPIKMKYFVMLVAAIAFLGAFGSNSGVSDVAHLSGLAIGVLFVKMPRVRGIDPLGSLQAGYKSWKLKRAKRKFQVYLRKQGPGRDTRVN